MKIGITGYKGLIGSELISRGGIPLEFDVTNQEEVQNELLIKNPDVVVHCAAKTDTNWCESNVNSATSINVGGVNNILRFLSSNQYFIFLSTAYIFDGLKYFDYSEHHVPAPINVYGYTKWGGEIVTQSYTEIPHLIVRISKVFNRAWMFPVEKLLVENKSAGLFTFSKRSFVHVKHFVDGLLYLIDLLVDGKIHNEIVNLSGTETVSYYTFWKQAASILSYNPDLVLPIDNDTNLVKFPKRAGLDVSKARKLCVPLYSYIDGLKEIKKETEN